MWPVKGGESSGKGGGGAARLGRCCAASARDFCGLRVDFYMVYYSPADHSELKRDLYTANFVFIFKSHVPNELIPINPLGMSVTYFREDQAFK